MSLNAWIAIWDEAGIKKLIETFKNIISCIAQKNNQTDPISFFPIN